MARPREFDIDEALQAAMEVFWDRGFEATSLADLMEATSLHKGSIYKAFGSKQELFTRALTQYLDDIYARMQSELEAPESAKEGIRRWMKIILEFCNEQATRRGCFALNSVVELGPQHVAPHGAQGLRERVGEGRLTRCREAVDRHSGRAAATDRPNLLSQPGQQRNSLQASPVTDSVRAGRASRRWLLDSSSRRLRTLRGRRSCRWQRPSRPQ